MRKTKGFVGKRESRTIKITENTLWTKTDMAIFAYFSYFKNKPATYRDIARAYVSSSYSNYQRACEHLTNKGYLLKQPDGTFKVSQTSWNNVQNGEDWPTVRRFPYFDMFQKKLTKRTLNT